MVTLTQKANTEWSTRTGISHSRIHVALKHMREERREFVSWTSEQNSVVKHAFLTLGLLHNNTRFHVVYYMPESFTAIVPPQTGPGVPAKSRHSQVESSRRLYNEPHDQESSRHSHGHLPEYREHAGMVGAQIHSATFGGVGGEQYALVILVRQF